MDSHEFSMNIAREAFNAYSEACGGVTYSGAPMPTWAELDDRARRGYAAFAKSAMSQFIAISSSLLDD